MKKILIGFLLAIGFSAIATVGTGGLIKADLINEILDIKILQNGTYSSQVQGGTNISNLRLTPHLESGTPTDWVDCFHLDSGSNVLPDSNSGTGYYKCVFAASLRSGKLICTGSLNEGVSNRTMSIVHDTDVVFVRTSYSNTGADVPTHFHLTCNKHTPEYKTIKELILEKIPTFSFQ